MERARLRRTVASRCKAEESGAPVLSGSSVWLIVNSEIAWLAWTGLHMSPWKIIGLLGALMFGCRWAVQFQASRRALRSTRRAIWPSPGKCGTAATSCCRTSMVPLRPQAAPAILADPCRLGSCWGQRMVAATHLAALQHRLATWPSAVSRAALAAKPASWAARHADAAVILVCRCLPDRGDVLHAGRFHFEQFPMDERAKALPHHARRK